MAPKAGRGLVVGDAAILEGTAKLFAFSYDDVDAYGNYYDKINSRLNNDPKKRGIVLPGEEMRLSPEGDRLLKDFAKDYINRIDNYVSQELDTKPASRTVDFHKEILRSFKRDLNNVANGISLVQDPELDSVGRRAVTSYFPQMNNKAFAPDRIEQTARALEQFPVDQYLKIGNDLQDMQESLAMERDQLSEEEIAKRNEAIQGKKQELLTVAKDLYEKSKNPTEDTIALFESKDCLTGPNGFMHRRGLESLINGLEREQAELDWQKKGIPKDMGEFSSRISNVVDIYGPNPKHHKNWEDRAVYSKDQFEKDLEKYNTNGLHFTETELALIGMAYTGLETKENIAARNNCPKPNGTNRENLEHNTFWTSDLVANQNGPRENLVSYAPMIQAGRAGAQKVAKAYAAGDKKQLAEVIQNSFRINQNQISLEDGIGSTSGSLTYLSQKTFLGMLDKDPDLRREFDAINQAAPEKDKVDLDKVRNQCEISKYALDRMNASQDLSQNPKAAQEHLQEMQKKVLAANILDGVVKEERIKAANHPDQVRETIEIQRRFDEMMRDPSKADEANQISMRALENAHKESELRPYLVTEEGKKKLADFTDHMLKDYGTEEPKNDVANQKQYMRYKAEISKFTTDLLKDADLAKLNSGKDLTTQEKRQIVENHIRREIVSEGYDRFLKTGEQNHYLEMLGGNATVYEKKGIVSYGDKLKEYVANMDLEHMQPTEISEMLKLGAYREMTDKIEKSAELEHERSKKSTGPSLDSALEDLKEGKRNAWFGKSDYNNVLSDLDKMNTFYQEHGKEILEKGTEAIDPELAKKQEELLKNMDAYLARKEREFAENKERGKTDNAHSRERFDAMTNAKKALQERMEYDKRINGLIAADKEYQEYAKEVAESRKGEPAEKVTEQKVEQPATDKKVDRKLAAQMKKFDQEFKRFRDMSQNMFHEDSPDSAAFGLNTWQFQAAKVIAMAGVKIGIEQGEIPSNEIDHEVRKNIRRVANSKEFKDWVKEAYEDPKKVEQLGKMSPEEVRMEFVKGMSKNMNKEMNKQADELKKEETKTNKRKKDEPKKSLKKEELAKTGP